MKLHHVLLAALVFACTIFGFSKHSAAQPACYPIAEVQAEHVALNNFWGTSIPLCQLNSGANNAIAFRGQGYVGADPAWLIQMSQQFGPWAVTGIMAHEWGHMVQGNVTGTAAELQADCLAGVFLRGMGFPPGTAVQFANANFFAGDAEFSFGGHGTGSQRVSAVRRGYNGFVGQTGSYLLALCPLSAF